MPCYRFGPFELDPEARLLRREGEPIPLAGKTLDTLLVLVENRGRLVDKDELLARVWAGSVVEEANLTQTIFTVRKVLGDSPKDHRYIATVPGRGYQFVAPVLERTTGTPAASGNGPEAPTQAPRFWHKKRVLPFGAVGIVLASLAAGIAAWSVRRADREDIRLKSPELYRLTSYPGMETMPAFSPDGKEIAYVRAERDPIVGFMGERREGQANIYVKLVGAATELRLTHHPGADYYPSWSPDGQYLAFYRHEPGASGFYLVSALGGQERRITQQETEGAGLAWLPDGRHLVISHASEGAHPASLIQLSLDTGEERSMTSPRGPGVGDTWPALSPDGKTLAFVRFKDSLAADVCFAPLSGSAPRCWPLQGDWPLGLTWTASGDGIIVAATHKGPYQLWRYPLSGAAPVPLTSGEENAAFPTTSRLGNHLAYVLYRRNVNLWELNVKDPPSVRPADARPVASSTRQQTDPAFSPDGRKIAFLSDRSGAQEIWVTETDTQTSTQLTHFGGPPTGSPNWSPDGQQIAFDSQQGVTTDIFVISAEGGAPRRITTGPGENCVPSWSPEGKSIYFASNRSGSFQIWKVGAATGETPSHPAIPVTRGGGFRAFASADGQYLYYANDRGKPGLSRRNLADGQEEPVLDSLQRWCWWALGPDVIYFLERPRSVPPQVHLKAFDMAEGRIRELGTVRYAVVEGTPAIAVSRDGRHVVYTQIDSMEADIMLRENFR
jgi:Tol biopolymer transport system component/DNA-binding winged helix-turn-helix (wHTH) protein